MEIYCKQNQYIDFKSFVKDDLEENKFLAAQMNSLLFQAARKSRKEKVRNLKIREITNAQHKIIETLETVQLRRFCGYMSQNYKTITGMEC